MAKYIDQSAAIARLTHLEVTKPTVTMTDAKRALADMFPADVAPVVHSYWEGYSCSQYMGTDECGEPKWRDGRFFVCHNYKCRRKTVIKSNYCPNCGAKMDGGTDDAANGNV